MDDLLREFLTETGEHLDTVDLELVRFEQDPNNQTILRNIFRLVHTIKGTCGFLGLPRLEALAHAAETLMGKFRDGMPVTSPAVSLILQTLDRIKLIVAELERTAAEPAGIDEDLIGALERMSEGEVPAPEPVAAIPAVAGGILVEQVLERALKPGEVSLDDLERAFRDTPGPEAEAEPEVVAAPPAPSPAPVRAAEPAAKAEAPAAEADHAAVSKVQTIRVNVETLEHLMTMVSELVLTRNQLLEIARRHE
ncbi:Hpt domain-containing protein, partial [uncultured Methylobacterium sp.]|uniref:Hpt domain-containing protein n=1 Tax=uncultured Methylobacterium sp. TaxID=157278 RepID=UPI0026125C9C